MADLAEERKEVQKAVLPLAELVANRQQRERD